MEQLAGTAMSRGKHALHGRRPRHWWRLAWDGKVHAYSAFGEISSASACETLAVTNRLRRPLKGDTWCPLCLRTLGYHVDEHPSIDPPPVDTETPAAHLRQERTPIVDRTGDRQPAPTPRQEINMPTTVCPTVETTTSDRPDIPLPVTVAESAEMPVPPGPCCRPKSCTFPLCEC